jgi:ABC-type oligopeptide transport system substrate-binding subunit
MLSSDVLSSASCRDNPMNNLPRTLSISVARTGLGAMVLGLALLGLWTSSDLWGQAPEKPDNGAKPKNQRNEEEEDTPPVRKSPKTKVIRTEEEEDTKKPSKDGASAAAVGKLADLADQTKQPAIRKLFRDLAVPHDQMVYKPKNVTVNNQPAPGERNIDPIPYYIPDAEKFRGNLGVIEFDLKWNRDKVTHHPLMTSLRQIRPYERIAAERVREFLSANWPPQNKNYVPPLEKLVAAEQVLSAVLRWHESARQTGVREGDEWAPIEAELRKQLLDEVLLKQLEILADAQDWDRVMELARRMASNYTNSADRERIAKPIAELLKKAFNDPTGTDEKKQEVRKRLHQLEEEFPDNPALRPLGESLRQQAQEFLNAAKGLADGKNDPDKVQRIRANLQQAKDLWPQLPGLRAFELELSQDHPVLRVGIRGEPPALLSPALACTDNERRVVEMLFESLVKLTPDDAGVYRYRLGMAEYRPRVVTLGREFQLPRNASWYNPKPVGERPPPRLDSGDIRFTMELLKQGEGTGRSVAWGQLLDNVEVKGDPFRVTLRLNQGYLDPLALMTFKILPRDWDVKSEQFAKDPISSGPFRLVGFRSDERQRGHLSFMANPAYGARSSKRDLPHIQEVRLYSYQKPVEEMRKGELDLVLDLTADEADQLLQQAEPLRVQVLLPTPTTPNRRIYFLAVNNLKVSDPQLRLALYYAINREGLLNKYFRKSLKQLHKSLNSPFPAGSWACNLNGKIRADKNNLDPFDLNRAKSLSVNRKSLGGVPLKLKYPKGEPALDEAMSELCEQVKVATEIVLEPLPCDPHRLREDVEQTQSYDLAYYHYDFPDETCWLWPLFSPQRATDDGNFLKYTNEDLQQQLKDATSHRNFAQVRKHVQQVHRILDQEMPLIPLWQLDSLLAYTRDVSPVDLDPLLVFTSVEEWRLQRK